MHFFERLGPFQYRATEHVGGAWNADEQHIAPALGLLAHEIELDHHRRHEHPMRLSRVSYDILGTLPIDTVEIEVSVLRPGRTIELVEARLSHGGRIGVLARAWFLQPSDTSDLAGSTETRIPGPEEMAQWRTSSLWPGGFVRAMQVRQTPIEPGRAIAWVRTDAGLIAGEAISATAAALGIVDIANGMAPRVAPGEAAFPNVDLTVHLHRAPVAGWLGFDTAVTFGPDGVGLTHSTIHDETGPLGTVAQSLTIRR